jgi:uncharacterized membrane-anchored protein
MHIPGDPDPSWGLTIGLAFVVLGAGASWASIHLRSKAYATVRQVVGLASSGLAEKSLHTMRELRDTIDQIVPLDEVNIEPESLIVDPKLISVPANRLVSILNKKKRLKRRFEVLLWICSALFVPATIFLVSSIAGTILYFITFNVGWPWIIAAALAAVCAAAVMIMSSFYAYLYFRIQAALEAGQA